MVFAFGVNLLLAGLGAATGVLLARLLGASGRGELAAITLWPGIILTFGGLGIPHTIAFFAAALPEKELGAVYFNALALALIQSVVLIAVGLMIIPHALAGAFAHIIPLSLVYLCSIPMSLFAGICTGMLQGRLWIKAHSLLRTAPTAVYLILLFGWFELGQVSLEGMVQLLLFLLGFSSLSGWWLIRKRVRARFAVDRSLIKRLLSYGLKTQAANSVQSLNLRLDQLLISLFLTPQNLGHYVVAVAVAGIVTPLSSAIATVVLPEVAAQENRNQAAYVAETLRRSSTVLLVLAALLSTTVPWLLPLAYGAPFSSAVGPAQILLVGAVFLGVNGVLCEALRGMNRPGVPAVAELASLVITVVALFLLLPRYGITGAAVASVMSYALSFLVMAAYFLKTERLAAGSLLPTAADFRALASGVAVHCRRRRVAPAV